MKPLSALAPLQRAWRRAGSSLALVAALSFVFETPLALAQTPPSDTLTSAPVPEKAKPKPKKVVHKQTATDMVSDDLNRRETERATQFVQQMTGSASASSAVTTSPVTMVRLTVRSRSGNATTRSLRTPLRAPTPSP